MRVGRQRQVGLCVAITSGLAGLMSPFAVGEAGARPPVHAVTSVIPDARLVTVKLDVLLGHGDETRRTAGLSASLSAWLLRGPSVDMEYGGLERRAHRAGLAVRADVTWDKTSLTLTGPAELAALAGALTADRLAPGHVSDDFVEQMQEVVWSGHEESLQDVVGPMGSVTDTAAAALEVGRTAFASRHAASRLRLEVFRRHVRSALEAVPARVVIVGPEVAVREALAAFEARWPTVTRATSESEAPPLLSEPQRMEHPKTLDLEQASDAQHHLAVAWTLRGLAVEQGLTAAARDAGLLALRAWLSHPGSELVRRVVDQLGVVHDLDTHLVEHAAPVLVLEARVSAGNPADARHALLEALKVTAESADTAMSGARRLALTDLLARHQDVSGRAELLSDLIASGRAVDTASVASWIAAVTEALVTEDPTALTAFVRAALQPLRRLVVTAAPAPPAEGGRTGVLSLGPDALGTYLRLLVDLQCPGPKYPSKVATLLREKYGISPREYAEMTRAMARDRRLLRGLAEDAERRCRELERLRSIMTAERVVSLHEAVACGPGVAPTSKRGRRQLTKVFRRFGVDPSWYRPLRHMAQEQPGVGHALELIDQRCPAREGPQ